MGLLKFQVGTLIGCIISFVTQRLPMLHTFDGPRCMKNEKYMKHVIAITFFHVTGSIKSMQYAHSLDEELNFSSNEYSCSKLE